MSQALILALSGYDFSCCSACPVIFYEKLDVRYPIIETMVNRKLVCCFILIWLMVGLSSVFTVAVGTRGFRFLFLSSPLSLGFPKSSYLKRVNVL